MADSTIQEMLIFKNLTDSKGYQFDINALYCAILIIMIIWYSLTKDNNICSKCANPLNEPYSSVSPPSMQYVAPMHNFGRELFLEKMKAIEFNPY